MRERTVTVLGGGVAGLAAAVLLARDGHRVTVLERDPVTAGDDAEGAVAWERKGIPHFLQPHAFIPRGRAELRDRLPDVYAALLAAGARDVDLRRKMPPGEPEPGDEDFQYLAVRRPLVEWGLRRAALAEPGVTVRDRVAVTGLRVEDGRVTGVEAGGATVAADVVVDASGRRTQVPGWLAAAGVDVPPEETSDCGVVYYCRYYRQRPGFELPDGPWLLSPRGDLGYLAFATFPGDNGTFAALLAVPPGVPEWKVFRDPAAFEAAVATIPALRSWVDPDGTDPITDVLPMAGLRNALRACAATNVLPAGDAYGHTDPVLAHGLAFALVHAAAVADALREHDGADAAAAYAAATEPLLRERYDLATGLDAQRLRMWLGEPVELTRHDGPDYALWSVAAAGAAAMADAALFRNYVRRLGLLASTAILDDDPGTRRRVDEVFARVRATPRPPAGPPRDELLAALP